MITKISKTEQIKAKLKAAGQVTYLDQPNHVKAIVAMNEQLAVVRREYQVKDSNSQTTASRVILTA